MMIQMKVKGSKVMVKYSKFSIFISSIGRLSSNRLGLLKPSRGIHIAKAKGAKVNIKYKKITILQITWAVPFRLSSNL
jgi:hypothetical protein